MIDRSNALSKLTGAAHTLMTHYGELPERVQKAYNDLLKFAGCDEFSEVAKDILIDPPPKGGDWSRVTKQQYLDVAGAVFHYLTQLK